MPAKTNTFLRLTISIALALVGVYLLVAKDRTEGGRALAQSGPDYASTWEAKSLLIGRYQETEPMNSQGLCETPNHRDPISGGNEIVFGVASWEVKGTIDSATRYKEVWSVPPIPDFFSYRGRWEDNRCKDIVTAVLGSREFQANINKWLLGYIQVAGRPAVQLSVRPANAFVNNRINLVLPGHGVSNLGKATSCQVIDGRVTCFFSTGPYSFAIWHAMNTATYGKHRAAGMLMPLKWTVNGFICDSSTDQRCN